MIFSAFNLPRATEWKSFGKRLFNARDAFSASRTRKTAPDFRPQHAQAPMRRRRRLIRVGENTAWML
jgi:hypothetical protein